MNWVGATFKQSFTLIEMLIVVVIIGILASALIPRLQDAQVRTRDTIRKKDMITLQTALKMHHTDLNRYPTSMYPACTPSSIPNNSWCNSVESISWSHWIGHGALSPYISQDPIDPKPKEVATRWAKWAGIYFYFSYDSVGRGCGPGQAYMLLFSMELQKNMKNEVRFCNGDTYADSSSRAFARSAINWN